MAHSAQVAPAVRRWVSALAALTLVLGTASIALVSTATPVSAAPPASSASTYAAGTPTVATITDGTSAAPWNEYQGDSSYPSYTSQSPGAVLPLFTPGGADGASGTGGTAELNLAVYPGASSGTDGNSPYPSGVVGSPGTLTGYCGAGSDTQVAGGSPVTQPPGTKLPLAPAYFPHIVRNSDGSLTGYFDYRPKDADETIVAATSTDNGKDWTYDGEALDQNNGYCPVGDTNDDGEGHPNVITVGGVSRLYTLPRAAGDNVGTGMLVHTLTPTASNPLAGLPAAEKTGIDPDDFASGAVSVPYCSGATPSTSTNSSITADPSSCQLAAVTIPLTNPIGSGLEALNAGEFVDLTQTPTPVASDVIYCSGVTSQSLTGCITNDSAGISVATNDLIEQVIGVANSDLAGSAEADSPVTDSLECHTSGSDVPVSSTSSTTFMPCEVPAGPNTTNGDGGLSGFVLDSDPTTTGGTFAPAAPFTAADDLTMATLNSNAPQRLYIDGQAVYCAQSNAYVSTEIENCTTGAGGTALEVHVGDPILSDPIVPATAQQTNGLVAPDGIVGVLPSYPGAPAGSTVVMYTEKVLNYYDVGYFGAASTFANISTLNFTDFPNTATPTLVPVNGVYTVSMGDFTAQTTVQVTCTGYTTTATTGTLTGCTNNAPAGTDVITKSTYIEGSGSAKVPLSTLQQIGEGKSGSKSGEKNFGNNEDLTVLRVAYTNDGINFLTTGLANGGIISGNNNCATSGTCSSTSSYDDINNPAEQVSPSNLNTYADNDAANGTAGSAGGTDTGGTSDTDEMRWVGSAGSIIVNPDGSYGLFLSGGWAADGDSDSFNQIFYTSSTDGEYWTVPTPVISTDYSFAASATEDSEVANGDNAAIGISAYYSGRAYAPSVVQNPNGTLTMLFAGDRVPKSIVTAGSTLGTNPSALYTPSPQDPALYRNILAVTLSSATSSAVGTQTSVTANPPVPVVGQPVTYTATVSVPSPGAGTPTGSVSFSDGTGSLCADAALSLTSPDTATCTTTFDGDAVTAEYSGDANYAGSDGSLDFAPGAPTAVSAAPGDGIAVVSWSPPATTGGAAVTGYSVTDGAGDTCSTDGSATSCEVSGLTDGTPSTFNVTATNSAGTSVPSSGTTVTPGASAQGPPTSGSVSVAAANGYTDQLTATNEVGPLTFTYTTTEPGITVSGTGAISVDSTLTAGSYTIGGAVSDAYGDSAQWTYVLTVSQSTPTTPYISDLPTSGTYGGSFTASVSTNGDGAPSVTSSTPSVCTVSGLVVTYVGVGDCTLVAHVAAGTDYTSADGSDQSITVGQASQTVQFTSAAPSPVYVGSQPYTPMASGGGSTSSVIISLDGASTGCALNEGVVTFTSVGTCLIDANQAGDANYTAAPQVQQSITVGPAFCSAGTYSDSGHAPCFQAPAGTYVPNSGATLPTNCQAGSFSSSPGSTSCTLAPAGQYVAYVGSTAASNCAAGSFSAAAGSISCTLAPAGSYVSAPGSQTATSCSPGSYSAAAGASSCTLAPLNTYVATTGATADTACPSGTFTETTGSTSSAACVVVVVTNPGNQSDYVFASITALANAQSNGIPTVTWSATGLPAGLSISTGGTITGTPTTPCSCSVTLMATDADGHTGTTTFTWTILPFSVTTTSLPDATPGKSYGPVTLMTAGAGISASPSVTTLKWLGAELPQGLKLSSAGVLSGKPNAKLPAGTYQVQVAVTEKVTILNGTKKVKTSTTAEATISLTIT